MVIAASLFFGTGDASCDADDSPVADSSPKGRKVSRKEKWFYPLLLLVLALVHVLLFFRFRKRVSKSGRSRLLGWVGEVLRDFKAGIGESNCLERLTGYATFLLPKRKKKKGRGSTSSRLNLAKAIKRKLAAIFSISGIEWDD